LHLYISLHLTLSLFSRLWKTWCTVDSTGTLSLMIRYRTDSQQWRAELQGPPHHDSPNKIMDQDYLFMGKRFQRGQVLRRVLLQVEPFPEQKNHIQQFDSASGKGGNILSQTNCKTFINFNQYLYLTSSRTRTNYALRIRHHLLGG